MTSSTTLKLVCYYNGELIDEDRDVRYIGGKTKAGYIPDTIGFKELRIWIRGLLKSSIEHNAIMIKCRYKVDDSTTIALDVDDDQSLKFVIDQWNPNHSIVAYIVEQPQENVDTAPIRTPTHEEGTPDAKVHEDKTGRKGGRPFGSKAKREEVTSTKEATAKKRGWHAMKRGKRHSSTGPIARRCGNCGVLGHNRKSCIKTPTNDDGNQDLNAPKNDLPLVVNSI